MTQPYRSLGRLDGAEVGVQLTDGGQDILIQQTPAGRALASLLLATAGDSPEAVRIGDTPYWRVPHSVPVDQVLMVLADLFIAIRYLHPSYVQLEIQFPAKTMES